MAFDLIVTIVYTRLTSHFWRILQTVFTLELIESLIPETRPGRAMLANRSSSLSMHEWFMLCLCPRMSRFNHAGGAEVRSDFDPFIAINRLKVSPAASSAYSITFRPQTAAAFSPCDPD
jgi:hypothetical protein